MLWRGVPSILPMQTIFYMGSSYLTYLENSVTHQCNRKGHKSPEKSLIFLLAEDEADEQLHDSHGGR
jgi:hypothetical protein